MGDRLLSEWRPFPGIKVTTELVPTKWGHVRNHTVESTIACTAYDCGFAVPKFAAGFAAAANGTRAEAHNDTCRCTVQGPWRRGLPCERLPQHEPVRPQHGHPRGQVRRPRRHVRLYHHSGEPARIILLAPSGGSAAVGEECHGRNISTRVLFLRPSATVPPRRTCHFPRIGGVCLAEGGL